jgi:hypothetical protein
MAPVPYKPLATVEDMLDGPFRYMLQGASDTFAASTMTRASRNIESRCTRRLAPFGPVTQSERAEGVASDDPGYTAMPMSMTSTLALSRAQAFGASAGNLVRDVWLADFAPEWPELWTYSDVSVLIRPPLGGDGQTVRPDALEGPQPDTGHLRLPFGTYCPIGSTIEVTYSGGYTRGTPDDLVQAAMLQAAKLLILSVSPERRADLSTADLNDEIDRLLRPYGGAVRQVARVKK